MKKYLINSQIYARCSIKQRASLNKTTSVVLSSDGRGFIFLSISFQVFLLRFTIYIRWLFAFPSISLVFDFGRFDLPRRLLCPISLATLTPHFRHFAPPLRMLCPFPSGSLGALLWEGRGRREEDGRRAGEKRPSEVAVRDDERRGRSCPENYWFGGGVEAINSYI